MKPTVTTEEHSAHTNVSVNGKYIGWVSPSVVYPGAWFWTEDGRGATGRADTSAEAVAALVAAYEGNGEAGE